MNATTMCSLARVPLRTNTTRVDDTLLQAPAPKLTLAAAVSALLAAKCAAQLAVTPPPPVSIAEQLETPIPASRSRTSPSAARAPYNPDTVIEVFFLRGNGDCRVTVIMFNAPCAVVDWPICITEK